MTRRRHITLYIDKQNAQNTRQPHPLLGGYPCNKEAFVATAGADGRTGKMQFQPVCLARCVRASTLFCAALLGGSIHQTPSRFVLYIYVILMCVQYTATTTVQKSTKRSVTYSEHGTTARVSCRVLGFVSPAKVRANAGVSSPSLTRH